MGLSTGLVTMPAGRGTVSKAWGCQQDVGLSAGCRSVSRTFDNASRTLTQPARLMTQSDSDTSRTNDIVSRTSGTISRTSDTASRSCTHVVSSVGALELTVRITSYNTFGQ